MLFFADIAEKGRELWLPKTRRRKSELSFLLVPGVQRIFRAFDQFIRAQRINLHIKMIIHSDTKPFNQNPNTKRFKRTLIYFDRDTVYIFWGKSPLSSHKTTRKQDKRLKTIENDRKTNKQTNKQQEQQQQNNVASK